MKLYDELYFEITIKGQKSELEKFIRFLKSGERGGVDAAAARPHRERLLPHARRPPASRGGLTPCAANST